MDNLENRAVKELLLKIREGDDDSFSSLAELYSPLIRATASRMGLDVREVYSDAVLALYKAALSFDLEKDGVTFGLYAQVCLRRRLLDLIKGERRRGEHEEDFDVERISVDSGILSRLVREEERLWLHSSARQLLSSLEYSVFSLWLSGLKTADIAEELSLEAKAVDNAKSRILKKLRDGLPQHRSDD